MNFDRFMFIVIGAIITLTLIVISTIVAVGSANRVDKTLTTVIDGIKQAVRTITISATHLNEASEGLAAGASRQAAAIEETSATMEQTSKMVEQNAETTKIANQLAEKSAQAGIEAGESMTKLVEIMNELTESSDKVGTILRTIDDIAFQTNLLAINATVEAARAGEIGKSFGVVAEAVRDLAQKCATAAADTTEIVEGNIKLAKSSKDAAMQVLEITEKDGVNVENLNISLNEISVASSEQADGVRQINTAVGQMEKITQENAAIAEETAAASYGMKDEINKLGETIKAAEELVTKR
jgi:methyl-accepting chemotaxis protein